jgi:DmsE family decaheme c-type cytochrome
LRNRLVVSVVIGLVALASAGTACFAEDDKPKDMALRGDAQCTRCHDQDSSFPVLAIGQTKHGTKADARTPTCSSCHGPSTGHANKPEDQKTRSKPDILFSKKASTPSEVRNQACLTCHQGNKRIHWAGSMHASRDVTCSSCHQVHTQHDKVRDKVTQSDVCLSCHTQQRSEIHRPSRHPILEGKVACSDCHNAHGGAGEKMLVRDNVNDTCYQCHMEKRGPFVRTHQPVQENCAICHNPHGSTVDSLLRTRAPLLCQQCHEPTSHRGGIPGFNPGQGTGSGTVGITLARACMNCHTNIHGTNNPSNSSNQRTFRR